MASLRGMVYDKYRTIGSFSKAIGWSRSKASRIINGEQQPSRSEMEALIVVLGIEQEDVAPIFFGQVFTK